MTILDVLKEDHNEVSETLRKISRLRTARSRERYFVEMKQSLEMHSYLEQLIFYREMMGVPEHKDAVERAIREHQLLTDQLAELDSLPKDDQEWMDKFRLLKENIQDHVEEEESDLFDRARRSFSEERLETLGAEMATKKAEQLATQ